MKTIRFFRLLVVRAIILAAIMMVWSFVTELIQTSGFFDDTPYQMYGWGNHISYHWGWRHYIWSGMGIALVIISFARTIAWGDWYWTQAKKEDNVDLTADENKIF